MSGRSVIDEAIAGSGRVGDLHHELEALQHTMGDPDQADKLDEVLYSLSESLRIVSILLLPILPEESNAMRAQLNWSGEPTLANTAWGLLPDAHQLGDPVPLFPRIEVPA